MPRGRVELVSPSSPCCKGFIISVSNTARTTGLHSLGHSIEMGGNMMGKVSFKLLYEPPSLGDLVFRRLSTWISLERGQ